MLRRQLQLLYNESPSLTIATLILLAAFVPSVLGIFLDSRLIMGAPAWLKPAKFAISSAIYSASIAWLFRYIVIRPRMKRILGGTIAAILLLEVALIDMQAARGTTSHFNAATPFDAAVFGVMGISILILWLASIGILVLLFQQSFTDRAWGWALRFGLLISIVGAGAGGFMVRPTPAQIENIKHRVAPLRTGAHTVGAPDGDAGLPGLNWSLHHGDLRVPHFFGLHGLQLIPFAAWIFRRRERESASVFIVATGYLGLVAILTWQALRGQSIAEPDARTWIALVALFAGCAAAWLLTRKKPAAQFPHGMEARSL